MMDQRHIGVLILDGSTSSLDCVRAVESPLKALGLPTRMPVLRGHGASSPAALRGVTWQDWLSDAESAMKDSLEEMGKIIIMGLNMNGLTTITLPTEHREQIESIILIDAAIQFTYPLAPVNHFE